MPAYLVKLDPENTGARSTLPGGKDAVVVFAANAADAKAMAKGSVDGDADPKWDNATATQIQADGDFSDDGWSLFVAIIDSDPVVEIEISTGTSFADYFNNMVTALNNESIISGASFADPALTVAAGAGADDLGDKKVVAEFRYNGVAVPGLIASITDEGAANADLTVTAANSPSAPKVEASVAQ